MISSSDVTPGWTVLDEFRAMLKEAVAYERRTIVFVHYAGHGTEINDNLRFADGNLEKSFGVDRAFFKFVDEQSYLEPNANVDVVFIFDACCSHLPTRSA